MVSEIFDHKLWIDLTADFSFKDDELGGNTTLVPDVGKSMNMRYQLWNHMKYEILIVRELVALGYYKLRGWIQLLDAGYELQATGYCKLATERRLKTAKNQPFPSVLQYRFTQLSPLNKLYSSKNRSV